MAVRKALLFFGQSNATPIASYDDWVALHLEWNLAIGSVLTTPSIGSYSDAFSIPGNFPGFSSVDLRFRAHRGIRYLTFYNPLASGYLSYPGTGRLAATGHDAGGAFIWVHQVFDPATTGFTIVRQLTGVTHTVTAVAAPGGGDPADAGARLTVTPAWTTPVPGEQFTYKLQVTAVAGSNVTFNVTFGKLWAGKLTGMKLTRASDSATRIVQSVAGAVLTLDGSAVIGDVFTISPQSGAFDRLAYWLPWSPFDGANVAANPNPYPPGFDYPGQYHVPTSYKAATAAAALAPRMVTFDSGLALKIGSMLGEELYVLNSGIGATSLTRSVAPSDTSTKIGWFDGYQFTCWAPGESNNCYQRLLDEIDAGVVSAAADGDTIKFIGVVFAHGEQDALQEAAARNYANNLRELKARLRADLFSRGLLEGSADQLIWIQPKIATSGAIPWPYGELVNDCIEQSVDEDPYMRSFSISDSSKVNGHYTPAGVVLAEDAAFYAWREARAANSQNDVVALSNAALSTIGDPGVVTSVFPSDGSLQADRCATFYPKARDAVLSLRRWTFAMRRKILTAVDSDWPQWQFAYRLPADCITVVDVIHKDAADDFVVPAMQPGSLFSFDATAGMVGVKVPQTHTVERLPDGSEILYTNQENAALRYVARVTDTRRYPELFKMALEKVLASMIVGSIVKGDTGMRLSAALMQQAMAQVSVAAAVNANQKQNNPPHVVPWFGVRGGVFGQHS